MATKTSCESKRSSAYSVDTVGTKRTSGTMGTRELGKGKKNTVGAGGTKRTSGTIGKKELGKIVNCWYGWNQENQWNHRNKGTGEKSKLLVLVEPTEPVKLQEPRNSWKQRNPTMILVKPREPVEQ